MPRARCARGACLAFGWALAALLLCVPVTVRAQTPIPDTAAAQDTLPRNTFDFGWTTLQYGVGMGIDYADYLQDSASVEQVSPEGGFFLRDFRLLVRGVFRGDRKVDWRIGLMYDRVTNSVRFRQTGLNVPIGDSWGSVFIGRTKEGVSLMRATNGYYIWTLERYPFSDAVLPILADGVRWYGYSPRLHLVWNLGGFVDWLAHIEGFSKESKIAAARLAWASVPDEPGGQVIHIGVNARWGDPAGETIRYRARPEAFSSPYYMDTGDMLSTSTGLLGGEAYYLKGPWMFGSEYSFQNVKSVVENDPWFHGGAVYASRIFGRGGRTYSAKGGGVFTNVIPEKSPSGEGDGEIVEEPGRAPSNGVLEVVLGLSYTDMTDNDIDGGTFWRITPTVSWYLSSHIRMEFDYGFGVLDRSGLKGDTNFFQSRWQVVF